MGKRIITGILFFNLFFLPTARSQGFKSFTLTGHLKGINVGTIEISDSYGNDPDFKVEHRNVSISDGKFMFKGMMSHPFRVYLNYSGKNGLLSSSEFFIDFGRQTMTASIDSTKIYDIKLKGSAINKEYLKNYQPLFTEVDADRSDWNRKYEAYTDKLKADPESSLIDSLQNLLAVINNKNDHLFYTYVNTHRSSYLDLWELDRRLNMRYDDYLEKAYNLLDKSMYETQLGDRALQAITGLKKVQIGAKFPKLTLLDSNTRVMNLGFDSNKDSKFLFVDLWYSNCAGCIAQFPQLKDIHHRFKSSGFNIISISVRERHIEAWTKAIQKYQLIWPQFFDKNEFIIYHLYVHAFPSNFLLDGNGTILAKNMDPIQLKAFLSKNLNAELKK